MYVGWSERKSVPYRDTSNYVTWGATDVAGRLSRRAFRQEMCGYVGYSPFKNSFSASVRGWIREPLGGDVVQTRARYSRLGGCACHQRNRL